MQSRLFARETGDLAPHDLAQAITSGLLRSFAPAPQHRFHGEAASSAAHHRPHRLRAHAEGVGCLALDKFDGRLLLSGGAGGSIRLWDLEDCVSPHKLHTFRPVSTIARSTPDSRAGGGHSHGITHLAFYPFDPDAFLSSSYDKSLKLWSTDRAAVTAEFHLNATIYSHSTSPVADHLLVACATQHSNVRLVDLKSGSAVQALVARGGPVLCTSWSPRHQHVLVSGHADGKVRIWDVRRAGGVIAQLDQEDSLGVLHRFGHAAAAGIDWAQTSHFRASAQAHDEAVNGLQWTDDGRYLLSAGLDRRVRVWDAATGANTLASFGSLVQNQHAKTASFFVSPSALSTHGDLLFWPNEQEILVFDLHSGDMITRLRSPGSSNPVGPRGAETGRNRITSIVWRGAGGGGRHVGPVAGGGNSVGAIYSAHLDGQIRAWMPRIPGPDDVDEAIEQEPDEDDEVKSKKRKAVDNAYRSLMGKHITFT
ncbi:DNA excision repair protein ERCC-8 [Hirsutella rhossiliensis]|uniref:DNA excision repair protein ERCC-8 n=1 Tax=Hirsutella rhossiliensis TaxID=111463 RepID=A0A9P8N336_9HYPO|nr:DNA excision repair protein ERCC-8 [Hirsutella rhossiliensis]KAH0963822.1 DNA excision repair protein ERCC-8 [Hirsutella rhossiliensis]